MKKNALHNEDLIDGNLSDVSITSVESFASDSEIEEETKHVISIEERRMLLAKKLLVQHGLDSSKDGVEAISKLLFLGMHQDIIITSISNSFSINKNVSFYSPLKKKVITSVASNNINKDYASQNSDSDCGSRYYCSTKSGDIYCINPTNKKVLRFPQIQEKPIYVLEMALNGIYLFSAGADGNIYVWNVQSDDFVLKHTLAEHQSDVYALKAIGTKLYSCGQDAKIVVWNLQTMELEEIHYGHISSINSLDSFSENFIVSCGEDKTARYWNLKLKKHIILEVENFVDCVKLINKKHFVTVTVDGVVKLFSLSAKKCLMQIQLETVDDEWAVSMTSVLHTDVFFIGTSCGKIFVLKVQAEPSPLIEILDTLAVDGIVTSMSTSDCKKKLLVSAATENRLGRWKVCKVKKPGLYVFDISY